MCTASKRKTTHPLILGSASPRRRELLGLLDIEFDIASADIDESPRANESVAEQVERLALAKAAAVAASYTEPVLVLGSDTLVTIDQQPLGKPTSPQHAQQMLQQLSGRWHQVLTAVALVGAGQQQVMTVATEVLFRPLSEADIQRYWLTGEPADKAGAYGIQGHGGCFVEALKGSYSAVVGLPLVETERLLMPWIISAE